MVFSCFFDDPIDVGNLIFGSSAFSKTSLNIWNFMVHVLLKSGLENFEHYFTSMWDECNCAVVWAFFGIAFLWDLNENWPFPVLWPLLSFPNLLAYWVQHFHSIIFHDLKQLNWNCITSTYWVLQAAFRLDCGGIRFYVLRDKGTVVTGNKHRIPPEYLLVHSQLWKIFYGPSIVQR